MAWCRLELGHKPLSEHDDFIKWKHFLVTGPLCGEFTGPGEFPTQRPVTRSFDVFFDLRLNKRLSKQPWGWWFETLSWSLWRQCNEKWWLGSLKRRCIARLRWIKALKSDWNRTRTEWGYTVHCLFWFSSEVYLADHVKRWGHSLDSYLCITVIMMTSSNGNTSRVTSHLWGEFTGPRWIPRTKAIDAELWCFLSSASE